MKTARKLERNREDMVEMMSKLLRKEAAQNVDIDIFSGDPVDCHYFIVLKKWLRRRLMVLEIG